VNENPPPNDDPVTCKRCGDAVKLLTALPRTGDQPAYRIFECSACGAVDWKPQTAK
jgi:DNA-directed RNA polymerase subunit M/transcription elongation factor TFIIS